MDIQVASNFERLLHDLYSQNGKDIKQIMALFKKDHCIRVDNNKHVQASNIFSSYSIFL